LAREFEGREQRPEMGRTSVTTKPSEFARMKLPAC
jgi:hypothetical protein